jgi:hypothetical protein
MFLGYRYQLAHIIMQSLDERMIHEYLPIVICYCLLFKLCFQNPVHFANGFLFQLRTAYQFIGT